MLPRLKNIKNHLKQQLFWRFTVKKLKVSVAAGTLAALVLSASALTACKEGGFTTASIDKSYTYSNSYKNPNENEGATGMYEPKYAAYDEQLQKPQKGEIIAVIHTNFGDMYARFFPEVAPLAVENFVTHSKRGYYNGLEAFRVIQGFMMQTGTPSNDGKGGESIWGGNFSDEFNVSARNYYGALSMANSGKNTNGSQFFIVTAKNGSEAEFTIKYYKYDADTKKYPSEVIENYAQNGGTPWLDFQHTVFGQIYDGFDILDKINAVGSEDDSGKTSKTVIIQSIEIKTF
jgi:peptidyl-prolyl cis-trans isomerase B (cyclophilin B)